MCKQATRLIITVVLLITTAACSAPGPRRGGGEDLTRWANTDNSDPAVGLWHGRANCRFGPLSNDEVLVGLRRDKNQYLGYIARIPTSINPAIVSWRSQGQVDSEGRLVLLPILPKRQVLSVAQPITVMINEAQADTLVARAGDLSQAGNPASRCKPLSLQRVSDGNASDFLITGRLSDADALTSARSLTGLRNDLDGVWEGSMLCRDRIEPVRVNIDRSTAGGWTATFQFGTRSAIQYGLEPIPGRSDVAYRFTSDDKYHLRRKGALNSFSGNDLFEQDGRATWLRVGGGANCEDATLYRYDPVQGLGGAYAEADGFLAMCKAVASTWLMNLAQEREAGKSLKVDLSRSLANYDPERASRSIVTDPERFSRLFGLPVTRWNDAQFEALSHQMAQCATIGEDGVRDTIRRGLFSDRALRAFGGATGKYSKWNPLANAAMSYALPQLQQTWSRNSAALSRIQSSALLATSTLQVESILSKAIPELETIPPSLVAIALQPVITQVQALRSATVKIRSSRFDGLSIPWAKLPTAEQPSIRQLINGQSLDMNSGSQPFLAGLALHGVRECGYLGENPSQANDIIGFVLAGTRRATTGGDHSNPSVTRAVADMLASNNRLKSGVETGKRLGCDDRFAQALVAALGDAIAFNRSDGQGGDSLFVRTCAVEFDRTRCNCLASKAQSVYPNVYQMRYSRSIIRGAIEGNILAGFAIWGQCGISDY